MDTTDAVNNLQGVNTQFDIVKETVAKALEQQITEAKQELSSALKNTTWDNLVIAFKKGIYYQLIINVIHSKR